MLFEWKHPHSGRYRGRQPCLFGRCLCSVKVPFSIRDLGQKVSEFLIEAGRRVNCPFPVEVRKGTVGFTLREELLMSDRTSLARTSLCTKSLDVDRQSATMTVLCAVSIKVGDNTLGGSRL